MMDPVSVPESCQDKGQPLYLFNFNGLPNNTIHISGFNDKDGSTVKLNTSILTITTPCYLQFWSLPNPTFFHHEAHPLILGSHIDSITSSSGIVS
jgi:hypothetical protein